MPRSPCCWDDSCNSDFGVIYTQYLCPYKLCSNFHQCVIVGKFTASLLLAPYFYYLVPMDALKSRQFDHRLFIKEILLFFTTYILYFIHLYIQLFLSVEVNSGTDSIGHGGHVPPTFTSGWAQGDRE